VTIHGSVVAKVGMGPTFGLDSALGEVDGCDEQAEKSNVRERSTRESELFFLFIGTSSSFRSGKDP
jgi:hypothetical protein